MGGGEEGGGGVARGGEFVQTVDDLVFNHFLLHSLQSRGWWWGDHQQRRKGKERRRKGREASCKNSSKCTGNSTQAEIELLWRSRYRLGRRIEDGSMEGVQIRAAEDADAADAVRFVHFYESEAERDEVLNFVNEFNVYVPEHAMGIIEVFESPHSMICASSLS
uniref:Uncharacterized protein n=1 Tax=Guillardia theta TaxID=55529 RepID=A0A6U6EBW9_GUITH